jgi:Nucleoside-diphosphate-sugar pyrophosphorylase involved in lipopolysaccharide biosynthesis/translation initiation factor 2B, gamma/epsilon subunits (eIF-2Bgamma/eIF-2Bepsilon)
MYDFSKELVVDLIGRGKRIQGHMISGLWRDVGRPSDLLETNIIMASVNDENSVYVGKGSKVVDSKLSETVISKNSEVLDSTMTRTLIMENSSIKGSKITGSIIGKGCVITNCTIVNTVLGDGEKRNGETIGEK